MEPTVSVSTQWLLRTSNTSLSGDTLFMIVWSRAASDVHCIPLSENKIISHNIYGNGIEENIYNDYISFLYDFITSVNDDAKHCARFLSTFNAY